MTDEERARDDAKQGLQTFISGLTAFCVGLDFYCAKARRCQSQESRRQAVQLPSEPRNMLGQLHRGGSGGMPVCKASDYI